MLKSHKDCMIVEDIVARMKHSRTTWEEKRPATRVADLPRAVLSPTALYSQTSDHMCVQH